MLHHLAMVCHRLAANVFSELFLSALKFHAESCSLTSIYVTDLTWLLELLSRINFLSSVCFNMKSSLLLLTQQKYTLFLIYEERN